MFTLAIILSVVVIFMFGFLWYGPFFSKAWMKANNIPDDAPKNMKVSSFALNIFGTILMVIGFYFLVGMTGAVTFSQMCIVGFVIWVAFVLPSLLDAMAWKNVSFKALLIDGVYKYASILIAGGFLFLL